MASLFAAYAHASAPPALNALGQAGGLVIPYAFALPEGTAQAQYDNYLDPRYGQRATGAQFYWGAVGLLPYVEVSGGLANYPGDVPAAYSGADHFVFRHLMADIKVQVPQFFRYQPAIAFGMTDVGGQTHYFRSKYAVVSQNVGPATLTLGYGQGDRLNGLFGGMQLALWSTGLSLLAEDDAKTPYAGVRYQSPPLRWLADASVIGTAMRSLRSTGGVAPRTSFSVAVQIPLGHRFDPPSGELQTSDDAAGRASASIVADHDVQAAPRPIPVNAVLAPAADIHSAPVSDSLATQSFGMQKVVPVQVDDALGEPSDEPAALDSIVSRLFANGLERVRAGVDGRDLIVEYENHRYNQNEADALGIVLGVASVNAPAGIERIRAVIRKDGLVIGELTIDRAAYARFLADGTPGTLASTMTMRTRPDYDANSVAWHGDEHRHGLTRIEIKPIMNYLYGTEYGKLDASIGANVVGYVPLWQGAELVASYVAPFYHTANMDAGRVFSQYRLHAGLADAALAQSFWIAPGVLNVLAVGRFDFHNVGAENETTVFVPGRPDLVRLRLAYLRQEPGNESLPREVNAALTYRWVQPAWKLWVEAGAARFVGGDKGPLITVTRWFDDVSFSVYAEHSGQGSYVGAAISFPLTPRQGMKPGMTQIGGADQFSLDFATRVGGTNYVNSTADKSIDFAYNPQSVLLNQGRFSAEYFATQLYRMRDAYQRYAVPSSGTPKDAQPEKHAAAFGARHRRTVCANFYRAVGTDSQPSDSCQ